VAIYALKFLDCVQPQLAAIGKRDRERILQRLRRLAQDPWGPGTAPLTGDLKGRRRLRVGDHRIVYTVRQDELVVLVVTVGHRKHVYEEARKKGRPRGETGS